MKICPDCEKEKQKEVKEPYIMDRCDYCGKHSIVGTVEELTMEDLFPGFNGKL